MSRVLIIPEPHISDINIDGRKDYIGEIKGYMMDVLNLVKEDASIDNVAFVGDIFNRGFKTSIDEYFFWIDWFAVLDNIVAERFGKIYSVVGNHELSYSQGNPFWRMVTKDSFNTAKRWSDKAHYALGLKSLIHVEDILDLDNSTIFFCHYNGMDLCKEIVDKHVEVYKDTKKRFCLSHNSIISSAIANTLRENYGRDPLTHFIAHERIESLDLFHKFDYVFNGHMHKAFSNFTITDNSTGHETKLYYLGSLGRTNSEEINNSDLKRVLPCIDTLTGEVDFYPVELISRENSLIDNYDAIKEQKVEVKKTYNEICERIQDIENPIKSLINALTDRDMIVALECSINSQRPQKLLEIMSYQ